MKTKAKRKLMTLASVMFSFFILVFNNSCQKENNASASVSPQIVYTDIIPDTILSASGSVYNLDINKDGIADYTITNNYTSIMLSCIAHNGVLLDSSSHAPGGAFPLGKEFNSNAGIWKDTSGIMTYTLSRIGGCGPTGNHPQNGCKNYYAQSPWGSYYSRSTEAYLGFNIYKGVSIYYAWAKIKVAVPNPFVNHLTVTIEDYAYNNSPNQSILAGQIK